MGRGSVPRPPGGGPVHPVDAPLGGDPPPATTVPPRKAPRRTSAPFCQRARRRPRSPAGLKVVSPHTISVIPRCASCSAGIPEFRRPPTDATVRRRNDPAPGGRFFHLPSNHRLPRSRKRAVGVGDAKSRAAGRPGRRPISGVNSLWVRLLWRTGKSVAALAVIGSGACTRRPDDAQFPRRPGRPAGVPVRRQ